MAQVTVCDMCDRRGAERMFLPLDRCTDAAGGVETVGEAFDLCDACCRRVLKWLLRKELDDWDLNRKVVHWIQQRTTTAARKGPGGSS